MVKSNKHGEASANTCMRTCGAPARIERLASVCIDVHQCAQLGTMPDGTYTTSDVNQSSGSTRPARNHFPFGKTSISKDWPGQRDARDQISHASGVVKCPVLVLCYFPV